MRLAASRALFSEGSRIEISSAIDADDDQQLDEREALAGLGGVALHGSSSLGVRPGRAHNRRERLLAVTRDGRGMSLPIEPAHPRRSPPRNNRWQAGTCKMKDAGSRCQASRHPIGRKLHGRSISGTVEPKCVRVGRSEAGVAANVAETAKHSIRGVQRKFGCHAKAGASPLPRHRNVQAEARTGGVAGRGGLLAISLAPATSAKLSGIACASRGLLHNFAATAPAASDASLVPHSGGLRAVEPLQNRRQNARFGVGEWAGRPRPPPPRTCPPPPNDSSNAAQSRPPLLRKLTFTVRSATASGDGVLADQQRRPPPRRFSSAR